MAFEYRKGERLLVTLPLDSTSADIEVGDAITASGATSGYFKEVDAAAEAVVGIAVSKVSSPSADGGAEVKVDISRQSVYEVGPDAGSVTVALNMKSADVGADARSVDIDGSTTDDIEIIEADTVNNKILVRLNQSLTGVA